MAQITKASDPSLATNTPPDSCRVGVPKRVGGTFAGEDINAFDACYIKSDGLVFKAIGAAANALAKVRGFAPKKYYAGEPIHLYRDVQVNYGSGMTPGANLFLSDSVYGGLADAATTGGTAPVGFAVTATVAYLHGGHY